MSLWQSPCPRALFRHDDGGAVVLQSALPLLPFLVNVYLPHSANLDFFESLL